jgi:hypothetical protein
VLTRLWYEDMSERGQFEDLGGGKIILKLILKKHVLRTWTDLSGNGNGQAVGWCEHGNELSF